jgi:hypothetical protein
MRITSVPVIDPRQRAAPPSAQSGGELETIMNAIASPPNAAPMDWGPLAATETALEAWTCAWEVWAGYLGRLAAASGPADVMEAGARLSLESLDICGRMAATRLGGLRTPLLNDA